MGYRVVCKVLSNTLLLSIFFAFACERSGYESKAGYPVHHSASSVAVLADELDISAIAFRTSTPVSHYFGNIGASLYGESCSRSGRELRSRRYGAIALAFDKRVLRFRSVEDLIWYMDEKEISEDDFMAIGIVDFISADRLMKPENLIYHLSRNLPSPGGSWVSAMDPSVDASLLFNIGEAYPGTRHSWKELNDLLKKGKEK